MVASMKVNTKMGKRMEKDIMYGVIKVFIKAIG
jgi:hypothetical protein